MMITAPPRPPRTAVPAPDALRILSYGLHWLHDTPQPDWAIIDAHRAAASTGNRLIRFVPLGWAWRAGVVVDVADVHWGAGPAGGPLNPMHSYEVEALAARLREEIGAAIAEIRCRPAGLTATIALARPAHPTLCAAVRRYMAGCPMHHSRRCGQPRHHGGHDDCRWYSAGQRGVTWPFTPWDAQHEPAVRAPQSSPAAHSGAPTPWEVPT